jgi:hypothetical protein
MFMGSKLLRTSADEQRRTANFFRKLATPITPEESHITRDQSDSSALIIRLSTISVGVLLLLSGSLTKASVARWIDMSIGFVLAVTALPLKALIAGYSTNTGRNRHP